MTHCPKCRSPIFSDGTMCGLCKLESEAYEAGARDMRERAALTVLCVRAKPEVANNDWFPLRSRAAKDIRALPLRSEP